MAFPSTIEALTALVTEVEKEEAEAIKQHGEGSREHRAARSNVGIAQRHLAAAVAKEERRKESEGRSVKEVVDRVYGR
jgi:hypothetical protein